MRQQQLTTVAVEAPKSRGLQMTSKNLVRSLLIGLGIMLILSIIGLLLLLLFVPLVHFGIFFAQNPAIFLLPFLELVGGMLGALLLAQPFALYTYLRAAHRVQQNYHDLYTPLKAVTNLRTVSETYTHDQIAPKASEEQISLVDLMKQQHTHQMILGVPGAGKTTALRVYQYEATQNPFGVIRERQRIPIYLPMKNYSLFLKQAASDDPDTFQQITILEYLVQSDIPGIGSLRNYLPALSAQGRLLLLCDGLNEVDSNYVQRVSEELVYWMRETSNLLVMTCREVDYREQEAFAQLVDEGQAARAVIYPLLPNQVSEFVERYVLNQGEQWQHSAHEIIEVIDRSRLRYHCTNPMMLFTLMGIIDRIGVERGKQIDTRGRLLREYVHQMIEYEQRQPKWNNREAPKLREIIRFLAEIACAARWAHDRNAIQLHISSPVVIGGEERSRASLDEQADELRYWLDEHTAKSPFEDGIEASFEVYEDMPTLVQFSLSTGLIELSPKGVLSFRHELIAEYFVAEYFVLSDPRKHLSSLMLREELLENVAHWSEPVAIWVGLLENPLVLAERFGALGRSNPASVLQALSLGLICVGVLWTPPQADVQRHVVLPPSLEEALALAVRNKDAREELAHIFTSCAEQGGQEVYRSLLPLLMVEGVDDLLLLLDQNIVPEVLLSHLVDAVDNLAYEAQVKRLARILGRFGGVVVDRAILLSVPAPGRSVRLRAAAMNILGGTNDQRAVEPLCERLQDAETFIVGRAVNALVRLGPELTLPLVLPVLENRAMTVVIARAHQAVLTIIGRFLEETNPQRQLASMQYTRVLESTASLLTSNYQHEADVQQLARQIFVQQARTTGNLTKNETRSEKAIEILLRFLPSQNEVAAQNVVLALQEIGEPALPRLRALLQQPSELIRLRVLDILQSIKSIEALPQFFQMLTDPSVTIQQHVARALLVYAPDSIPGLLQLILKQSDEKLAERAALILRDIGPLAIDPILEILFEIVPGRTRLLVQILAHIHDPRVISTLIDFLPVTLDEPPLAIAVIRALAQFPDFHVVPPLISVLTHENLLITEEAIDALSQLRLITLNDLVTELDVPERTMLIQRIYRVIQGMQPFPGPDLVELLRLCTENQQHHLMEIFKAQGSDAALVLAENLLHPQLQVRETIQKTMGELDGSVAVPALLDVLQQTALRRTAGQFLLKYPEAAILPLVRLLGEPERGDTAVQLLPFFGLRILRPLLTSIEDLRGAARDQAQDILVALVQHESASQEVLQELVSQLHPSLGDRARDVLLRVLSGELAEQSLPALLIGLADSQRMEEAAEALMLMSRRPTYQNRVIEQLVHSLHQEERRRGAEIALVRIGGAAVSSVGELLVDHDPLVMRAARIVLRDIGVEALPYIWKLFSDRSHPARRKAALEVFHSMPTETVKNELVDLLVSETPDNMAMAVSLLLERIADETGFHSPDQGMIPLLLEYVQTSDSPETNGRVLALLLLLGEKIVLEPVMQALSSPEEMRRPLLPLLTMMGEDAQESLLDIFLDQRTPTDLKADLAGILGMTIAPDAITQIALQLSTYGLSSTQSGKLSAERLNIALRALGGLLGGGAWDVAHLQDLRHVVKEGSGSQELIHILLGGRYGPRIAQLQNQLSDEQEKHKQELLTLTNKIVEDQEQIQGIKEQLERAKDAHSRREEDLVKIKDEHTGLQQALQNMVADQKDLQAQFLQSEKQREGLQDQVAQTTKQYTALASRFNMVQKEKQMLAEQYEQLLQQLQGPSGGSSMSGKGKR